MGLKKRGEAEAETCSFNEALLFATMCIVGLPVDVHVRDGSVYSGTFHTASVYGQYGIVLKDAKLTKKGKCETNVVNGSVVDMLVILSGDLVQVVAKGVLLPADDDLRKIVGVDAEVSVNNVPVSEVDVSDVKSSANSSVDKNKITPRGLSKNKNMKANGFVPRKAEKDCDGRKLPLNHVEDYIKVGPVKGEASNILEDGQVSFPSVNGGQNGDDRLNGEHTQVKETPCVQSEKSADEEQSSSLNVDTCFTEEKSVEEGYLMTERVPNGVSSEVAPVVKMDNSASSSLDAVCSKIPSSSNSVVYNSSESHHSLSAPSADVASPQSTETNKNSKEFKLNPGAKVFSPSFVKPIAVTSPPLPPFASMAYVPGNLPLLPVAAAQPEVGINPFAPRSSVPSKFSPFNNLTAGKGGSSSQFSQPITGHMESRTQPFRYGGQYHTVQTAATYAPPNSQAVMVGRLSQLVYMQPVPPDFVQNTAAISPVPARPLMSPHQVQYPKHQGNAVGQTMQVSMPSPFLGVGQQPLVMPSYIPVMQPIPANLPSPVQGSNAVFSSKFP